MSKKRCPGFILLVPDLVVNDVVEPGKCESKPSRIFFHLEQVDVIFHAFILHVWTCVYLEFHD